MNKKLEAAQMQNPEQIFNDQLRAWLADNQFDITEDERAVIAQIQDRIHGASAAILGGDLERFKRLHEIGREGEINLLDASCFLNVVERLSPQSMSLSVKDYIELLENASQLATKWNAQVLPKKTSLMREIQAKLSRNIIMPHGKKLIRAEA